MSNRLGNPRDRFHRRNLNTLRENLRKGIRPQLIIDDSTLTEPEAIDKIDTHGIALFWQEE